MLTFTRLALLTSIVAASVIAQPGVGTRGIPCCNDYTINGFGSGTTSCTKYTNASGSPLTFEICASGPGLPVIFAFSFCPCSPGSAVLPSCCAPINSFDLSLFCPLYLLNGVTVPHPACCGVASFTLPFCPAGLSFSTQAAVIDPTCPTGLQLTQAYDVCCF